MTLSKSVHATGKGRPLAEAARQAPPLFKILIALFATATLLGAAVAAFVGLSEVTVNVLTPIQASNAFSASFAIVNSGAVKLNHVNVLVGICRVDMKLSGAFDLRRPRAMSIRGDGAKFTPGSAGCTGPNGAPFYNREWTNHELAPHDKFSASLDPVLDWLIPSQARDSVTVTSATITVVVQFEPWIIPWRREAEFRFGTQKEPDGTFRWFGSSLQSR